MAAILYQPQCVNHDNCKNHDFTEQLSQGKGWNSFHLSACFYFVCMLIFDLLLHILVNEKSLHLPSEACKNHKSHYRFPYD